MAEKKPVPGVAPEDQERVKGDLAEQRYGAAMETQMPPDTAAPGSARQLIEQILLEKGLIRPAVAPEPDKTAGQRLRDEAEARAKAIEENVGKQARYRATGPGWIPGPDPKAGWLYVWPGQEFLYHGPPSDRWMAPLDGLAETKLKQAKADREERERRLREMEPQLLALTNIADQMRRTAAVTPGGRGGDPGSHVPKGDR